MVAVMLVSCESCKKEGPIGPMGPAGVNGVDGAPGPAGPSGPQGQQGPQGPKGIEGNANVAKYTYSGHDFSITVNKTLTAPISKDSSDRCVWLFYLVRPGNNVYQIPGFGLDAVSDYRAYYNAATSATTFYIKKVSGPGEAYNSIRIIRIYANTLISGRKSSQLPDIDFNDYNAVCKYYGLSTE